MDIKRKPFKNIVGKWENAGKQRFLLSPQFILPFPEQVWIFQRICSRLQMLLIWTSLKICCLVKS